MKSPGSAGTLAKRIIALGIVAWAAVSMPAEAQETVSISVPNAISFPVIDVSQATPGSPNSTRISFADATLDPGRALRISVLAGAAAFTSPSGPSIPATNVSWTTPAAAGGIGWSGTLSSSSYALVFQGDQGSTSGHVDVRWSLAAPGRDVRAGLHDLTIRWKIEAITP